MFFPKLPDLTLGDTRDEHLTKRILNTRSLNKKTAYEEKRKNDSQTMNEQKN